jgi:hypothetical protein
MLVVGGYLITYKQFGLIGQRRGIDTENGKVSVLNNDLRRKGITSVYALPVEYPRSTPSVVGESKILICTNRRLDYLVSLSECKPFVEGEDDRRAKKWLELNGIQDAPFVAVPDPLGQYNEYGEDYD